MFDPRKQQINNHIHILDHKSYEPLNFGSQISQKLGNWTRKDGGVQFKVQNIEDHEDDGVFSPPLWQTSPPRSPVQPVNYRSLSPNSRAQEIARGQWELMEMVKNMPESCYELSLKDIVEQQQQPIISFESQDQKYLIKNRVKVKRQESNNHKKNNDEKKAKMMRSKSIENGGLFLKMVSPVSLRSKKKKKKFENCSKSLEKDWWKKRFSGSSSASSRTSSNSSRNNNRKGKGFLSSCWSKLCFSKSISAG